MNFGTSKQPKIPQVSVTPPREYPDELTNGRYHAYIHGYNVSENKARGSQSNIFKRLHQLGSNARFIGVFWYGDPPPPLAIASPPLPPDYHKAVYNGFITGDALKESLSFTKGASLSIMAHSLGNMPTSHAIANRGLQVDNYIMIDAAVPIEAYDAAQTSNSDNENMPLNMTENQWKGYYNYGVGAEKGKQQRLFAANWYRLFEPTDNRSKLTWKNIFAKPHLLSKAYNFYSTGEEVVENADASETFGGNTANMVNIGTSRHAWVAQEIAKGGEFIATGAPFDELNGGWKHNYISYHRFSTKGPKGYYKWVNGPSGRQTRRFNTQEASEISNNALKIKPFYNPFIFPNLYDTSKGSAEAGNDNKRYKVLATGVPAMSYAAASNSMPKLSIVNGNKKRNFNMQDELKSRGLIAWPPLDSKHPKDWGHSDFKDVSFQFVYPLYQKIIELGSLNQN